LEKPKRKYTLGEFAVDGRTIKMDLKYGVGMWTGLNWLMIDSSGGHV
jgi:hypothetical protein